MMDHTMTKNPVSIPHFIWPADALRRAEKAAADSLGLTLFELMMRAGEAAFQRARADYPASKHWLILCGHGNNGGDGYVVARLAQADGIAVTLLALESEKALPEEASAARDAWVERRWNHSRRRYPLATGYFSHYRRASWHRAA